MSQQMNFEPKTAFLFFANSESFQSAAKPIAGKKTKLAIVV